MAKTLPLPSPRRPPAALEREPSRVDPARADAFVRAGVAADSSEYPAPERAPRAPAGTRALVERRDGRTRRKMMVYLAPETADALTRHCRAEGRELSHTVDAAIRAYLDAPL